MRPVEAMFMCADLRTKLQFAEFRWGLVSHLLQSNNITEKNEAFSMELATRLVDALGVITSEIPMYFVKDEMTDLIQHASNQLSDEDLIDVTIAPTRRGFVYFDKPIEGVDLRGESIKMNACVWFFDNTDSLLLYMFNDMYRTPDQPSQQILNDKMLQKRQEKLKQGRWSFIGMMAEKGGKPIGSPLPEQDEQTKTFYEESEGFTPVPSTNFIRVLHAYWLMMGQTLVHVTEERGDKRVARSQAQMGLPNLVTVIQYRRKENTNEYVGESSIEWSHRWIVRGHWRWQPYKDEQGKDSVKRIWIAPFMKGPDDKPLVITDKVYALIR